MGERDDPAGPASTGASGGRDADAAGTSVGAAETPGETDPAGSSAGGSTAASLAFLLGLLAFLGSAVAFVVDLATGAGVVRSLAINAAAALLLVARAAHDTLSDPDSDVRTLPGALGTATLLTGGYFLLAGIVLAATSLRHGRLDLALSLGAAGLAGVVVGFAVFSAEALPGDGSDPDGDGPEGS